MKLIRRRASCASYSSAARAYCDNLVQSRDYDNYALAHLLPTSWPSGSGSDSGGSSGPRAAYVACRALNAELASVREAVQGNAQTGQLRMQWWREDIKRVVQESRDSEVGAPASTTKGASEGLARPTHYVLRELGRHLPMCELSERWLLRGLEAREAELVSESHHSIADLEAYSEATCSSQLYLALETLDIRGPQYRRTPSPWDEEQLRNTLQAASHLGKAIGIVTALRGAIFAAHESGRCSLPRDVLDEAGITARGAAELLVGSSSEEGEGAGPAGDGSRAASARRGDPAALREAVFQIATVAHNHVEHAKELRGDVLPAAAPVLVASTIVAQHLERLRRCDFELRDPSFVVPGRFATQRALLYFSVFGGDGY